MTARISVMLWGPRSKWLTLALVAALALARCDDPDDWPDNPFWPQKPRR